MRQILLLEDEESLNRGIRFKLEKEGYKVFSSTGIEKGLLLFEENEIDLVICDIGLGDGNGLDFCKKIRKKSNVHFIFLTALDQEVDIVLGYEAGADDYITKPFSLTVLTSKVDALFRRIEGNESEKIKSGNICFFKSEMKIFVEDEEKLLSKNELRLLLMFMEHPKQILSKHKLLEALWDVNGDFVDENTIAVNVRRLREKIEKEPSNPTYIKNIRGIGYIWDKRCWKE